MKFHSLIQRSFNCTKSTRCTTPKDPRGLRSKGPVVPETRPRAHGRTDLRGCAHGRHAPAPPARVRALDAPERDSPLEGPLRARMSRRPLALAPRNARFWAFRLACCARSSKCGEFRIMSRSFTVKDPVSWSVSLHASLRVPKKWPSAQTVASLHLGVRLCVRKNLKPNLVGGWKSRPGAGIWRFAPGRFAPGPCREASPSRCVFGHWCLV